MTTDQTPPVENGARGTEEFESESGQNETQTESLPVADTVAPAEVGGAAEEEGGSAEPEANARRLANFRAKVAEKTGDVLETLQFSMQGQARALGGTRHWSQPLTGALAGYEAVADLSVRFQRVGTPRD